MKKEYIETAYELLRLRMFALCLTITIKGMKRENFNAAAGLLQEQASCKYAAYCNKLAELSKEYNRLLGEAAHMLVESTGVEYAKAVLEVKKTCRVNIFKNIMQSQQIDISKLRPNTGQIEGVPGNPRFIRDERFERLKESIRADPEMMQVREIVAYDNGGELVIIMGNMRYRVAKALGIKEVPVKILPQDTPAKKLQAYIIKDNVPFGETDWDMLANEWDTAELEEWGMELPVQWEADSGNDSGGKPQSPQVSFTMSPEQEEVLRRCIEAAKNSELYKQTPFFGNRSEDGNALYLIAVQWEEFQKTARGGGN